MNESHRDEDHHGFCGEEQYRCFAEELRKPEHQGKLRIGAIHHNVRSGSIRDSANLFDEPDLKRILAPHLHLLLHGHTHDGKSDVLTRDLPIYSTGSAALQIKQRPEEVANQYQVLRIRPGEIARWGLLYSRADKKWVGDTRISQRGDAWTVVDHYDMAGLDSGRKTVPHGTFEEPKDDFRVTKSFEAPHNPGEPFLRRVEKSYRAQYPTADLKWPLTHGGRSAFFFTAVRDDRGISVHELVGASQVPVSAERLRVFVEFHAREARLTPGLRSVFVTDEQPLPAGSLRTPVDDI
jgi:hypothetical protein